MSNVCSQLEKALKKAEEKIDASVVKYHETKKYDYTTNDIIDLADDISKEIDKTLNRGFSQCEKFINNSIKKDFENSSIVKSFFLSEYYISEREKYINRVVMDIIYSVILLQNDINNDLSGKTSVDNNFIVEVFIKNIQTQFSNIEIQDIILNSLTLHMDRFVMFWNSTVFNTFVELIDKQKSNKDYLYATEFVLTINQYIKNILFGTNKYRTAIVDERDKNNNMIYITNHISIYNEKYQLYYDNNFINPLGVASSYVVKPEENMSRIENTQDNLRYLTKHDPDGILSFNLFNNMLNRYERFVNEYSKKHLMLLVKLTFGSHYLYQRTRMPENKNYNPTIDKSEFIYIPFDIDVNQTFGKVRYDLYTKTMENSKHDHQFFLSALTDTYKAPVLNEKHNHTYETQFLLFLNACRWIYEDSQKSFMDKERRESAIEYANLLGIVYINAIECFHYTVPETEHNLDYSMNNFKNIDCQKVLYTDDFALLRHQYNRMKLTYGLY